MGTRHQGPRVEAYLPLTPVMFEILLALADAERHGYGILREVADRTGGRVRLRPGTLYRALQRVLAAALVENSEERPDPELDDERRRYYRLTDLGRRVLRAEAERLVFQVEAARSKKLLGASGGA
jgi:DNA-binding PadR family transcriptional regulator